MGDDRGIPCARQDPRLVAVVGFVCLLYGCSSRHRINLTVAPPDMSVVSDTSGSTVGTGAPIPTAMGEIAVIEVRCRGEMSKVEARSGFVFYSIPVSGYPHDLPDRCKVTTSDGEVVMLRVHASE